MHGRRIGEPQEPTGRDDGDRGHRNIEDASLRRLTLQAALAQLSDRDRELIALRYGGELTAAEIAGS